MTTTGIMRSRVASVGVRRVKSALARSKSSDKFVIGFKQPLFVNCDRLFFEADN